MTDGNDFINPSTHQNFDGTHDLNVHKGLTKREYFSAMALQGLLANNRHTYDSKFMSERAVVCADALIKTLNE